MARPYRKRHYKKKKQQTAQPQLKQVLPPTEVSPENEKAVAKPDNSRIFAKVMLVINIILCCLLAYLLFFEQKPDKTPEIVKCPAPTEYYHEVTTTPEVHSAEHENTFINTALNHDEAAEDTIFRLKTELEKSDKKISVPQDDLKESINVADTVNLTEEQIYELYEEKTPEEENNDQDIKRHKALPTTINTDKPLIAVVIDDMGVNISRTKDIISLHYPLTSSFLTYAANLGEQMNASRSSGHEIMGHLPMEPQVMQNYTPTMLTTKMSDEEIIASLRKMLALFPDVQTVNNHMGSKFTEDRHRMDIVMQELAKHHLKFLDSVTTQHSAAPSAAVHNGVKILVRNVFLDNKDDFDYITAQLHLTERIARSKGYAIAIGHPKAQTYHALRIWLPTVEKRGFRLIKLSEIFKYL